MVRVRLGSSVMYHAYESLHRDRNTRIYLCFVREDTQWCVKGKVREVQCM